MKQTRTFEHRAASVTEARRFACELLAGAPADVVQSVELMVSELATNCVRHTDSGFELTITVTTREVRVEAADCGGGDPTMQSPTPSDLSGRGLRIVDMLAGAWGVERLPVGPGKTVWFTLDVQAADVVGAG
ncbi:MAG: ATP-binding protein [Actinobacteria bacterium]|nr:ATP-binding protein [Actinomycetota bacterium]